MKELPSRPVGLSFPGLDALSLPLLKTVGTTADKKLKGKKIINICPLLLRGYKH